MTICVTGHRPDKLWGYDIGRIEYKILRRVFKQKLMKDHCNIAISGMALGTDTIYALAALELKAEGFPIKLACFIPCEGHSSKWNERDREIYDRILKLADYICLVNKGPYEAWKMQARNQAMVNHSNKVIALYDGSAGGTQNCVKYAESKGKDIHLIEPKWIEELAYG